MSDTYVQFQEVPRDHFTMIPNIVDEQFDLDPYAFRLYAHLRKVAGEGGASWQSTETLALFCRMSEGKISESKQVLVKAGLILIRKEPGEHGPYDVITIVDIWAENYAAYLKGSPGEPKPSLSEPKPSPGETKNIPLRKSLEEESASSSFQDQENPEPKEEPTIEARIIVLKDHASGLTVARDDAIKVAVEIGPRQQGFSCPECGTYHKFPMSKTKRKRAESLACVKCSALFCVSVIDPDGQSPPLIYDHPFTVQYYVGYPLIGEWATDEINGEDFLQNWKRDPVRVMELIAWVKERQIPDQWAVARINVACTNQIAGVKLAQKAMPTLVEEELPPIDDDVDGEHILF